MRLAQLKSMSLAGLVLSTTLIAPHPAKAQEIKGGFSMATISFSPEDGEPELSQIEPVNGFVGGVSFLFQTHRSAGIQIDALFQQKGARELLRFGDELRLGYLEVPVLLHIDVFKRGSRGVYVIAGPEVSLNVYASYLDEGDEQAVTDGIKDVDLGLSVGAGVELLPLTFETRYTWGLATTFDHGELDGPFKNHALSLTMGYRFGR